MVLSLVDIGLAFFSICLLTPSTIGLGAWTIKIGLIAEFQSKTFYRRISLQLLKLINHATKFAIIYIYIFFLCFKLMLL